MRLLPTFCGIVVLMSAGVAAAQPAPITYAGQGAQSSTLAQSSASPTNLAGGADNSYGYGAQRARSRGAVIDLRRGAQSNAPAALQPAAAEATRADTQPEQGAGRPQWLEQERVGAPYEANGRWYVPTPEPGYSENGQASWYGPTFHGQRTSSGEVFDEMALTAAHPTLPVPSLVQVTNLENGREVIVRVNDRGPFVGERLIDMSRGAAQVLGFEQAGQARVNVRYLGPAPRRVNADGSQASPTASPAAPRQERAQLTQNVGPASLMPPSVEEGDEDVVTPQAPTIQMTSLDQPRRAVSTAAPDHGYFVQVGAYSDLVNAHRVRDTASPAGPVIVDIRETSRGELFRVRVGPWPSRAEADAARQTLASLGYAEAVIAAP
ncbi:rare lipoprotein A precursor [alpha proteobacterium U9-1i]|nr:rare lipoprotein A precursor [alpha proteobacterium U9-1i]